jgi:hypothetical protein
MTSLSGRCSWATMALDCPHWGSRPPRGSAGCRTGLGRSGARRGSKPFSRRFPRRPPRLLRSPGPRGSQPGAVQVAKGGALQRVRFPSPRGRSRPSSAARAVRLTTVDVSANFRQPVRSGVTIGAEGSAFAACRRHRRLSDASAGDRYRLLISRRIRPSFRRCRLVGNPHPAGGPRTLPRFFRSHGRFAPNRCASGRTPLPRSRLGAWSRRKRAPRSCWSFPAAATEVCGRRQPAHASIHAAGSS